MEKSGDTVRLCIYYGEHRKSRIRRDLYRKIKLMLEEGLTIAEIANRLDVDTSLVRYLENGYGC